MPHDANEVELREGDQVVILATVTGITTGDKACNITVQINDLREDWAEWYNYKPLMTLNSKQLRKITTLKDLWPEFTPDKISDMYKKSAPDGVIITPANHEIREIGSESKPDSSCG